MIQGTVWKAVVASTVVLAAAGIVPRVAGPVVMERTQVAAAALASPRAGAVLATGVARTAGDLAWLAGEVNRRAPGAVAMAGATIARGARRTGGDLAWLASLPPPATLPIAAGVAILATLGAVIAARRGPRPARRRTPVRSPRSRDRVLGMVAGGRPVHGVARQLGLAQDGVRVLLHTAALDRPHRPGRFFRSAGSAGAGGGTTTRELRA